jgi:hypothetical protein
MGAQYYDISSRNKPKMKKKAGIFSRWVVYASSACDSITNIAGR